ncbi:MAG: hypothetical protein AMJ72_05400 [Acidithiobacillales bacterium SM1_46]|nr:MAG: hypothetical protein AMJ72_05400 [Acidithiobacillales bacterium SM1_46]
MHQHPQDIPVVAYYELNGVNFTYCWRAGCTSIAFLALNNGAKTLDEVPETCTLLLKNPIERFRSAQVILPDQKIRDPETGFVEIGPMPMDEYINGVLDDVEGVRSPHCWGQLEQHRAVKHLQLYRLEGTTHLAGVELPHLNKTMIVKPEVENHPRYQELLDFYAEDIEAWEKAAPLKNHE